MDTSVFDLSAKANDGKEISFRSFEGKVLLIVNTASKCGFTPQYAGLEALHRKYKDRGLVVVGFPCDQFAHQEPGDDEEIAQFCQRNYGVSFQIMAKVKVNGPGTHPVFAFLKAKAPGGLIKTVPWNFTKFLVSKDGTRVKRYAPTTEPTELEKDIEERL
ncbi:MAG TPA: glutathione peroxidase [Rectinemataceae bacterium]